MVAQSQAMHPGGGVVDEADYKYHASDSPATSTEDLEHKLGAVAANDAKEELKNPDGVTEDAQIGQQKAEAAALMWGKSTPWLLFAWIWICFFMLALQSQIFFYTTAFVYTSAGFNSTGQYATTMIVANIVGAVIFLPLAKIFNLWGRAEAFVIELSIYILGMIISASASTNSAYAAGYVIYLIGFDTLYNTLTIFVADISGLRNRAFAFAFVTTPFICTAFTGPLAGMAFLTGSTWQWSIGAFCIIQPVVLLPLAIVFKIYANRAQKAGLLVRKPSGRTFFRSLVHYFHEFDIIGCFILMAAFILFLLPFGLVTQLQTTYDSATFIAMLVIGIFMFVVFYLWERFGTRSQFLRWELLQDRSILGAVLTSIFTFMAFYSWDLYFYYFVTVVYDLSITNAGYMSQIYNVGSTFWAVIIGIWIRTFREFKYTTLCFSLPLLILGTGLSIHFRGQGDLGYVGYTVMCQIFIAFGGGAMSIGWDMAVMAASDRAGVPMVLSIIFTFTRIGGALGQAIGAAIYQKVYLQSLTDRLPGQPDLVMALYNGGYTGQMKYAPGTPEREAANFAWGQVMYYGAIAATALLVLDFPTIGMWKFYRLDRKQNKGNVI